MYQMKEQHKTPEKQLNEVDIDNLPGRGFRIMRVQMIQNFRKRMEAKIQKMQEMFNEDLGKLKNKQTGMNNTITEMKTILEGMCMFSFQLLCCSSLFVCSLILLDLC